MALIFGDSWGDFTAAHSRYWTKRNGRLFSRLCVADKLSFVLTPASLYLLMARATGELDEYMVGGQRTTGGYEGGRRMGNAVSRSKRVHRFSPIPNNYNNLGNLLSLKSQPY